jgi:hypothetical protein
MLLPALIALSIAQQHTVPHRMVLKTEAKSPHAVQATLIQDKRKAFEFFYLVKSGAPRPESIKKLNWKRSNVVIVYPGLVQRDAKISLKSVKRFGQTVQVTIDSRRGISAATYYPIFVLTIPRQDRGLDVKIYDPNKLRSSIRSRRRSLGA